MKDIFILDSWAILALLYAENPAASRVEQLVHQASANANVLLLPTINLGEVFYILGRRQGQDAAEAVVAHCKQLPIRLLQATEQRILAAARYKMRFAISYADAFAAAAAAEFAGTLVTGEPELQQLHGDVKIEFLPRVSPGAGNAGNP